METLINERKHKIVYIEYQDNLPHSVITACFIETAEKPYWRPFYWDFFACNGDEADMLAYNSGSGGKINELQSPHYRDGYNGASYWIDDFAKLDKPAINCRQIKNPRILTDGYTKSRNPFKTSQFTDVQEYCDVCGHFSDEFCYEHKYFDDDGNARYKHDNSFE